MPFNAATKPVPWDWQATRIQSDFRGIARGLVLALPMWEHAGPVVDVVHGFRSTPSGTTPGERLLGTFGFNVDNENADSDFHTFQQIHLGAKLDALSSLTLLMWSKTESHPAERRCVNKWDGSDGWMFIQRADGDMRFFIDTTAGVSFVAATGDTTTWHQYCGTYDSTATTGNHLIYKDGALASSEDKSGGAVTASTTQFRLGQSEDGSGSQYWDGQWAQVLVWNRPLNAQEIKKLYQDPFGIFRQDSQILTKAVAAALAHSTLGYMVPQ